MWPKTTVFGSTPIHLKIGMRPDGRQSHRDALTIMVTIYYVLFYVCYR